jgi:hypothetical protein
MYYPMNDDGVESKTPPLKRGFVCHAPDNPFVRHPTDMPIAGN